MIIYTDSPVVSGKTYYPDVLLCSYSN